MLTFGLRYDKIIKKFFFQKNTIAPHVLFLQQATAHKNVSYVIKNRSFNIPEYIVFCLLLTR